MGLIILSIRAEPLNQCRLHVNGLNQKLYICWCHNSDGRSLLVWGAAEHFSIKKGEKKLISLHNKKTKGLKHGCTAGYLADNSLSQTRFVISFSPPLGYSITCSWSDGRRDSDTYLKCFLATKNNPVIQKERIKTRKSAHVFAGKQVLKEGHFLMGLAGKHIYSTRAHFSGPCSLLSYFLLVWR